MKGLILFPFAFLRSNTGCFTRILSLLSWAVIAPCLCICVVIPFTDFNSDRELSASQKGGTRTAISWLTTSPTPSDTPTDTLTPTDTKTPTKTFTTTDTYTPSKTPTATDPRTPTYTYTATKTFTPSDTPTRTYTPTKTYTPTRTYTPTITPTPSDTRTHYPTAIPNTRVSRSTRYVNTTTLNVRGGPGTNYPVVGQLAFRDAFIVVGESGEWYRIVYEDETEAWVSKSLTVASRPSSSSGGTGGGSGSSATRVPGATSVPQATIPPAVSGCPCNQGNTLNCPNFSRQSEAQACFNKCMAEVGRDVHGLDGNDNDGLACESLP